MRIYTNWELALASFVLLIGFHATSDKNKPCLRCAGKICWRCYLESNWHLASITLPSRHRLGSVDLERLKGEFGICIWLTFFGSSNHDKQTFDICIAIREMWGHHMQHGNPALAVDATPKIIPPHQNTISTTACGDIGLIMSRLSLYKFMACHVVHSSSYGVMWGK